MVEQPWEVWVGFEVELPAVVIESAHAQDCDTAAQPCALARRTGLGHHWFLLHPQEHENR